MSKANKFSSWYLIGYIAPGAKSASQTGVSSNFEYNASAAPAMNETTGTALADFAKAVVLGAANIAALNECQIQSSGTAAASVHWTIKAKKANNGNSVLYKAEVNTKCKQLTPTFEDISSKGYSEG